MWLLQFFLAIWWPATPPTSQASRNSAAYGAAGVAAGGRKAESEPWPFYLTAWEEDKHVVGQANIELDEVGSLVDGRPQFFSAADIREIVQYAAERHIMVVPEIEMPGHTVAAIASYPELGVTGQPIDVATRWLARRA